MAEALSLRTKEHYVQKGDFLSFTSPEGKARGCACIAQQEKLDFYVKQNSYLGSVI